MDVAAATTDTTTIAGSIFRWLRTGEEAFVVMLDAIRNARRSIRLETYIYRAGTVGESFRAALIEACERGVKVRVLVDAFGSLGLPNAFWDPLTKAGGEFTWFNPLSLHRWSCRDHRKLLICDEQLGFIGGFNFADEYNGDGVAHGWRDLGLQVTGPLAKELAESFDNFLAGALHPPPNRRRWRRKKAQVTTGPDWKLLLSGPGIRYGLLKRSLVTDIEAAQSVKIICAYFVPTWRLRKSLMRIAKRGGDVQLILAGKSDVPLVQLATRRLYSAFLRSGVRIYEYEPQILHAKLFLMDDIVYAGSSNLDVRSLRINYELLVRTQNAQLAAQAREIFEADLEHSRRIDARSWVKTRTLWAKLRERWAYFLVARVDPYLAGRQLKTLRRFKTFRRVVE